MKITVLADNSVRRGNRWNAKSEDGLSLLIEFDERKILFDTGQSDQFIQNAEIMGIDLSQVHYLVVSQGNLNPGCGLSSFLKVNRKAVIFLHISAACGFNIKIIETIPYYIGPDQRVIAQKSRIFFIDEDTLIDDKIILLEGFPQGCQQADTNNALSDKGGNLFGTDRSGHEMVLLLIENNEIVLFSGCSHSGIIKIIEEVKLYSKDMRIKATLGGSQIRNSISNNNESQLHTEDITAVPGVSDPVFIAGLSTSDKNFLQIRGLRGNRIQTFNTGQVFEL